MAQLPYVEPDEEADPVTKGVYDRAEARFEMVLNIFKISGNAPEIAEKMWEIFFEILKDGQVDWKTKELLILKATKVGDCLYCVTQHEAVGSRLGISREKQADIVGVEYRDSPHYIDAEVAVLDLCSHDIRRRRSAARGDDHGVRGARRGRPVRPSVARRRRVAGRHAKVLRRSGQANVKADKCLPGAVTISAGSPSDPWIDDRSIPTDGRADRVLIHQMHLRLSEDEETAPATQGTIVERLHTPFPHTD